VSIRAFLRSQQARKTFCGAVFRGFIDRLGCSHQVAERRVKELYITHNDVQTRRVIFFNIRLALMLKTWYTFRKFHNR
jgi:hypothetical protein